MERKAQEKKPKSFLLESWDMALRIGRSIQLFGKNIELEGEIKTFHLTLYNAVIPSILNYEYERYTSLFKSLKLPILTGIDVHGNIFTYDMVDNPHLLIAGETGSGKSTQVRSVLTSIIQTLSPERIELYLCDLKRSEFFLFKNIEHVKGVYQSAREMLPMLQYLQLEMQKRGNQLNQHERSHVDDLPDPPPYILLCIDEVALLQDEKEIMKLVEEISAIGRALGVFLILSMQRSNSKILDGKLKNNLTVRMGFKCADLINSRIIGTPGSEKLTVKGRMLLKLPIYSKLIEIQASYLSVESAKRILERYKSHKPKKPNKEHLKSFEGVIDLQELENNIFGVLDK
jgi:S-DNA-T family DNA segregation ATPase FtsK/SpoIIIE